MQIRFPLEIKDKIEEIGMKLVDNAVIEFQGYVSGATGEFAQAGRAFRASKIAGSGRLDGNRVWIAPMPDLSGIPTQVITGKQLCKIKPSPWSDPGKQA